MFKFHEHLINLLKQNKNYVDDDGNILRNKVIEQRKNFYGKDSGYIICVG